MDWNMLVEKLGLTIQGRRKHRKPQTVTEGSICTILDLLFNQYDFLSGVGPYDFPLVVLQYKSNNSD
jgi:hypothetical protein